MGTSDRSELPATDIPGVFKKVSRPDQGRLFIIYVFYLSSMCFMGTFNRSKLPATDMPGVFTKVSRPDRSRVFTTTGSYMYFIHCCWLI